MYNVYTWYKQLSQQVLVVDRETQMQDSGTSLCPLLLGTIWMQAVPVQKMDIFLLPGQMLKIQRRPSTSFSKAWRARRVRTYSVHTFINIYVHTYINIYVHVCNMNIQQHKFMYMYVHCTLIRQNSCTCM